MVSSRQESVTWRGFRINFYLSVYHFNLTTPQSNIWVWFFLLFLTWYSFSISLPLSQSYLVLSLSCLEVHRSSWGIRWSNLPVRLHLRPDLYYRTIPCAAHFWSGRVGAIPVTCRFARSLTKKGGLAKASTTFRFGIPNQINGSRTVR